MNEAAWLLHVGIQKVILAATHPCRRVELRSKAWSHIACYMLKELSCQEAVWFRNQGIELLY